MAKQEKDRSLFERELLLASRPLFGRSFTLSRLEVNRMPKNLNKPEAIPKIGDRHSQTIVWRYNKDFYRFIGSECVQCGNIQFPRRWICAFCGSREIKEKRLKPTGIIKESQFGVYGVVRGLEDQQPQLFATVELDDGPWIDGEIVDVPPDMARREVSNSRGWEFFDSLKGKRVRIVLRRARKLDNGNLAYLYKFKVLDPPWRSKL